jgi:CRISPR type III-A-associated protein Csm2
MPKKVCDKCGKNFEAFKPEFTTCPKCKNPKPQPTGGDRIMRNDYRGNQGRGGQSNRYSNDRGGSGNESLKPEFKLQTFYTDTGHIVPMVFRETAQGIANQFNSAEIARSSLRSFYEMVRSINESYQNSEQDSAAKNLALQNINKLYPQAQYSQARKVTKQCFTDFMSHYIDMTARDIANLKGFKELFSSVICYLRKE